MKLGWSRASLADLDRLHDFLLPKSPRAAALAVERLQAQARTLIDHPRKGELIETDAPYEVRRLIVGDYEMQYYVAADYVRIARIWHTRENR